MTSKLHKPTIVVAILAFGGALLPSDNPPKLEASLKMRTGLQVSSFEDHLKHANYGFGVALGYNLTNKDNISLEVGWAYKPGYVFKPDLSNLPTAPGIEYRTDLATGRVKNTLSGLALRLAYERQFEGFGLIGGLQVGGTKYKHEYFGDVANGTSATAAGYFRDSYYGNLWNNPNGISPFIGLTKRFGTFTAVELNLVGLNYESIEYIHTVGYGLGQNKDWSHDYPVTDSRMALHLEIGYVVRF